MSYRVRLTTFKSDGKFYHKCTYKTHLAGLPEIWDEVRGMQDELCLPGLVRGHSPFIVMVDVPDHPHRHPHLIMP